MSKILNYIDIDNYGIQKMKSEEGGGSEINLQNKSISINQNGTTTVTADSNYDGLDEVEVTVNVSGTDTSDADATASDIAKNKTAYVNGQKITGNVNVYDASNNAPNATSNFNINTAFDSQLNIKHNFLRNEVGFYTYMTSKTYQVPYSNIVSTIGLTADKIKAGERVLGVTGTYEPAKTVFPFDKIHWEYNGEEEYIDMSWLGAVDTSSLTNMEDFFALIPVGETIPLFNTSNVINMSKAFNQQNYNGLVNIPEYDTSSVVDMTGAFAGNPNLTDDSLNNILVMCANVSEDYEQNKTLLDVGLYQHQAARCEDLSNWNTFINAGWTSGY